VIHRIADARQGGRIARALIVLGILFTFLCTLVSPVFAAGTTGTISGTVTTQSGTTTAPVAGVVVTAVSSNDKYTATTDAKGFFSLTGVNPDTYSISYRLAGYSTLTAGGITVAQDQVVTASTTLSKSLVTIGTTKARSTSSAFQPAQTVDQYNFNDTQIATTLGKTGATNEVNLLAAIPGASFDNTGYPVLRGGRQNEEGYQFEGIDYTDAFTSQFVNALVINGAANFQVTPGTGNASTGNSGTGSINVIAKRGKNPAFGQFEADVFSGYYTHELHGEYGFASPNGRFSNYSALYGSRGAAHYGAGGADPLPLGAFFGGRAYQWLNEVTNNAVYKFGRDNNQSLQLFYDNTGFVIHLGQGTENLSYKINDPLFLATAQQQLGLTKAQIQSVMPFTLGQTSLTQLIGGHGIELVSEPNATFKLQYANNLNASTFATAKFYRVNAVSIFDAPYNGTRAFFGDHVDLQGGQRTGFTLDLTKQLNSQNLLGIGGKFEYLHPVFSDPSASNALYTFGGFGNSFEVADFLPNDASCPLGPGGCGYLLGNNATSTAYVPPGTRLPYVSEGTATNRQDFALYVTDTYSPTAALKIELGLRLDGANYRLPTCDITWCLPTSEGFTGGVPDPAKDRFDYDASTRTPRVLEPRMSVAYQIGKNDGVRLAYGRSVTFPVLGFVDAAGQRFQFNAFNNVPSQDPLTGARATFCGTTFDRPCKSYADQLYWENAAVWSGIPINPLKPTTFQNWEASFTHQFPNAIAMKVTPFYRKAFDATALTAQPVVLNGVVQTDQFGQTLLGPSVPSNLGKSQITGVEFFATKTAAYGLSGSLSLTYQNEFSNVIPTSGGENFFPTIPPASLQLGNIYRVGFLSPLAGALAIQEKTRSGWRINPVIYYNHGYPYGSGLLTSATVNGKPYNVTQTNISIASQLGGSPFATQYVDPRNPGSIFKPNVAATRGTPETASAGGVLSAARFGPAQITIEYTSPTNPHSTFGVLIANVFDQLYGQPALNPRYQPIATGIAGPYSGYSSATANPAFRGVYNYTQGSGNQPYLLFPNNVPLNMQFYYQLTL
jgi:hypothetical protein